MPSRALSGREPKPLMEVLGRNRERIVELMEQAARTAKIRGKLDLRGFPQSSETLDPGHARIEQVLPERHRFTHLQVTPVPATPHLASKSTETSCEKGVGCAVGATAASVRQNGSALPAVGAAAAPSQPVPRKRRRTDQVLPTHSLNQAIGSLGRQFCRVCRAYRCKLHGVVPSSGPRKRRLAASSSADSGQNRLKLRNPLCQAPCMSTVPNTELLRHDASAFRRLREREALNMARDGTDSWTSEEKTLLQRLQRVEGMDCCSVAAIIGTRNCDQVRRFVAGPAATTALERVAMFTPQRTKRACKGDARERLVPAFASTSKQRAGSETTIAVPISRGKNKRGMIRG